MDMNFLLCYFENEVLELVFLEGEVLLDGGVVEGFYELEK